MISGEAYLFGYEIETNSTYLEGNVKKVLVNSYERNSQARLECLKHHGYNCFVCEINFVERYGELGKNFIHVHHLKQLSKIKKGYKVNPITDLNPVCPNCHAMLHRRNPPLTIEQLREVIKVTAANMVSYVKQ